MEKKISKNLIGIGQIIKQYFAMGYSPEEVEVLLNLDGKGETD